MKGIILAGGQATRLYPITKGVCKQLLPVYDKPMIYYPLSVLILAGIQDILIIAKSEDIPKFKGILNDGKEFGLNVSYEVQEAPRGIAEAFKIGEKFIADSDVCLILGDNIFYGNGLRNIMKNIQPAKDDNATVFGYYVKDPERYGVVEFDKNKNVLSIEEKPKVCKSNYAVCGLYFYPNSVIEIAQKIKPSNRGELEITDVNLEYLNRGKLKVELLGRGYAWLDTGTHDSLLDAGYFVKTVEDRQGLKIGCIEETAYRMGFISDEQLKSLASKMKNSYGDYLKTLGTEGQNSQFIFPIPV
jgi:glucose-1-phosphate thymidylyltransferase